jgi:hypothetical protein
MNQYTVLDRKTTKGPEKVSNFERYIKIKGNLHSHVEIQQGRKSHGNVCCHRDEKFPNLDLQNF